MYYVCTDMKKGEVALISGSSGFIGKHLSAKLIELGLKVAPIPREFLSSPVDLKGLLDEYNPQYIFHLATAGNMHNKDKRDDIFTANLINTYFLLSESKDIDYKAFVNFSTSSVLLPHETFYSATKAGAERLSRAFATQYGKPVVSVRPASVFGEGEQNEHLIPVMIDALKNNKEIQLVEDPTHSWIYVEDFVDAVIKVVENIEKVKGKEVNISYGKGSYQSNKEILDILERISGKKLKYKKVDSLRGYDTKNWSVENDILESLGWKIEIGLNAGLANSYNYDPKS